VTSWLLVCTGAVAVVTALIGYTAIGLENKCLLATYTILLVLVFMFESITGLLAYVYQEQIKSDLSAHLFNTFIQEYGVKKEVTYSVDRIQREFSCCGSNSFLDWRESPWRNKSLNPELLVPDSCCKTESPGCGVRDHLLRFSEQLSDHLQLLGVVSLALALLQIFGVIFTSCLFSRFSRMERYDSVRTNRRQSSGSSRLNGGYWTSA
ncbi:LOW QUALITY PROTEIN: CD151 antigen-like, partial [Eurytemora carolleeae]|uniref:LOW QUALITY PROTEIN: CD151 antigen-like n=1 Tax=Eurytemora carolleeae TaxID=1294199 RepID=UPI000C755EED